MINVRYFDIILKCNLCLLHTKQLNTSNRRHALLRTLFGEFVSVTIFIIFFFCCKNQYYPTVLEQDMSTLAVRV